MFVTTTIRQIAIRTILRSRVLQNGFNVSSVAMAGIVLTIFSVRERIHLRPHSRASMLLLQFDLFLSHLCDCSRCSCLYGNCCSYRRDGHSVASFAVRFLPFFDDTFISCSSSPFDVSLSTPLLIRLFALAYFDCRRRHHGLIPFGLGLAIEGRAIIGSSGPPKKPVGKKRAECDQMPSSRLRLPIEVLFCSPKGRRVSLSLSFHFTHLPFLQHQLKGSQL